MIKSPNFWQEEKDAPLLILDRGFLKDGNVLERVSKWPALVGITNVDTYELPPIAAPDRIIVEDAPRTFKSAEGRERFIRLGGRLRQDFGDYHQGLGYTIGFLTLSMEPATIVQLLSYINKNYIPGYWKWEAVKFATDAFVFQEIARKFEPELVAHLEKNLIGPSTFCQKWFVGLCVHVLPFQYLFTYFERFLKEGHPFLFKFGLSLLRHLKPKIMALNDVSKIYGLLRLDAKFITHDEELNKMIEDVFQTTEDFDISGFDLETMRTEMYDKHLRKGIEASKKAQEEVDDDEIEDCEICKDDFPEVYCKTCNLKICENCHAKPPADSKHLRAHKVKPIEDEEEEEEESEGEKEEEEGEQKAGEEDEKLNETLSKLSV